MKFIEYLAYNQRNKVFDRPLVNNDIATRNIGAFKSLKEQFSSDTFRIAADTADANSIWAHGLYGNQLRAKLFAVHFFVSKFNKNVLRRQSSQFTIQPIPTLPAEILNALRVSASDEPPATESSNQQNDEQSKKPRFFVAAFLKKIIEAVDVPLDSIVAALGINGSITEVKKLLGVSL